MNNSSSLSLYDFLNIYLAGLLICLPIANCNDYKMESVAFYVVSFIIGFFFQKLIELARNYINKLPPFRCIYLWIINIARESVLNTKNDKVTINEYLKAYYNVVRNGGLMNIPVLEAHSAFLNNISIVSIPYILLTFYKCAASNCLKVSMCCVEIIALILLVAGILLRLFIEYQIAHLVWEGNHYYSELSKNN